MAAISRRHSKGCASRTGGKCDCNAGWEASVYIARDDRKIRKTFQTAAAARSWRAHAAQSAQMGTLRATSLTVRQAVSEDWLQGAESGVIRNRSGDEYKPSVIRGYEEALRLRVLPAIGAHKLADVAVPDVQDLVDRWQAEGLSASAIRNTIVPLRVIYRRALARGIVAVNPTAGVELPAIRGTRDRIASPDEAGQLLDALEHDRALWATAFPDCAVEHRMNAKGDGLVFGRADGRPFNPSTLDSRAGRAWKAAGLKPIGLHEARHTFASLMIAAGVNAKALSTYMGHANIAITFDRYGHLMPGNETEAGGLLDAYLDRADTAARIAQLDTDTG